MKRICIDTSIFGIYLSRNPSDKVNILMKSIEEKKIAALVPKAVLIETYYHACKKYGKEDAQALLIGLINKYPLQLIDLNPELIINAGQLKCQHSSSLSYVDCMGIALALSEKIPFHTTEKNLKKIPHNVLSRLKIEKYTF